MQCGRWLHDEEPLDALDGFSSVSRLLDFSATATTCAQIICVFFIGTGAVLQLGGETVASSLPVPSLAHTRIPTVRRSCTSKLVAESFNNVENRKTPDRVKRPHFQHPSAKNPVQNIGLMNRDRPFGLPSVCRETPPKHAAQARFVAGPCCTTHFRELHLWPILVEKKQKTHTHYS